MKLLAVLLSFVASAGSFASGFDIRGTVQDGQGNPLADAKVWLVQEREARAAQTDAAGQFVFSDANAGFSNLVIWKEGYAFGGHSGIVLGPETLTFTLGSPVELALRVIDYAYRPVEGARIANMILNRDIVIPFDDLVEAGFPSARSGEDGRLVFAGFPERAMVELRVAHRDFVETHLQPVPVGQQVLTVQLRGGKTLRGRAVDEAGSGVGGGLVSVLDVGRGPSGECAETRTDPEGYFRLKVLPGQYDVGVRRSGFAPAVPRRVEVGDTATETAVDLTLLPPRFILGRVVDPAGAPAAGVWLASFLDMGLYDEALTTLDGSFRLKACPGDSTLRVLPPDGTLVREGDALAVKLEGNEVSIPDIHLDRLPEIVGAVLTPDNEPAPNVLLSSLNLDPPIWHITDPEGRFQIQLERTPAGPAHFRAEHALRFLRTDFEVDLRAPAEVSTTLTPFEPNLAPAKAEGGLTDLAELVGQAAPELQCDTWLNLPSDGQTEAQSSGLKELRGKVVVLTFWDGADDSALAHFVIEELRALHDLFRFNKADDAAIVAIHEKAASADEVRQYVERNHIEFPVGLDVDSRATFKLYKIRAIPQTVLIDRSGVLRYFDVAGRLLELIKDLRRGT